MKNALIKLVGLFLITILATVGCDSITDSEVSGIETLSETITAEGLQADNKAHNANNSLGKVDVGVDASVWDSDLTPDSDNGIFPIGGSGQVNGEFTIATIQGVEIGLRAQERFEGTIEANGNRVGVYNTLTSFGNPGDTGVWNYDWHIDLRGGTNAHANRTLGDYNATLELDFTEGGDLFGLSVPLNLTSLNPALENAVLFQQSWNPGFGNDIYDPSVAKTYNFRLVLIPETFNGPPLAVAIEVDVK